MPPPILERRKFDVDCLARAEVLQRIDHQARNTVLATDVLEQLLHRVLVRRVATVGHRHAAVAVDLGGEPVETLGIARCHRDDETVMRQLLGERISEPRSDAHDECDFWWCRVSVRIAEMTTSRFEGSSRHPPVSPRVLQLGCQLQPLA